VLKLSDPVSLIPFEFRVSESRRRAAALEFRRRIGYDALVDAAEDRREAARQFIGDANHLVDSILDPAAATSPRFVHVAPVRFGRTRLFLAKFIGRAAWRQGVNL
jgi:hypothetical protein